MEFSNLTLTVERTKEACLCAKVTRFEVFLALVENVRQGRVKRKSQGPRRKFTAIDISNRSFDALECHVNDPYSKYIRSFFEIL